MSDPTREILTQLLTVPESQLAPSMVERLRKLLDEATTPEEMKLGLKDVLDLSAHGALASTFVMKILDYEWKRLGGKPGDPVSEEVMRACR